MNAPEALRTHLLQLRDRGQQFGRIADPNWLANCRAWIVSVENAVGLACDFKGPYVAAVKARAHRTTETIIDNTKDNLVALLTSLIRDLDAGMLNSMANAVRAETYDDLLDHAKAYLDEGRKDPAGILAGVVFEDTIRRIARDTGIVDKNVSLEDLINALAKTPKLPGTKPKRAKAAAHVRTKATHAQWTEFDAEDVKATITLTRELIDTVLS